MRVKMNYQITGTRNGVAWPPPGGEIDLPNEEAMSLCQARLAAPVAVPDEKVETRKRAPRTRKPKAE